MNVTYVRPWRYRMTMDDMLATIDRLGANELTRLADAVIDRLDDIDGDSDLEPDEDVGADDLGEEERAF